MQVYIGCTAFLLLYCDLEGILRDFLRFVVINCEPGLESLPAFPSNATFIVFVITFAQGKFKDSRTLEPMRFPVDPVARMATKANAQPTCVAADRWSLIREAESIEQVKPSK